MRIRSRNKEGLERGPHREAEGRQVESSFRRNGNEAFLGPGTSKQLGLRGRWGRLTRMSLSTSRGSLGTLAATWQVRPQGNGDSIRPAGPRRFKPLRCLEGGRGLRRPGRQEGPNPGRRRSGDNQPKGTRGRIRRRVHSGRGDGHVLAVEGMGRIIWLVNRADLRQPRRTLKPQKLSHQYMGDNPEAQEEG